MKTLLKFIKAENAWQAIFKQPLYEITTASGRQAVANHIDNKLSPENLTCDGELPRAEVQRRFKMLTHAANELRMLDPTVTFCEY